jgi:hypothetical protein
MKLASILERVMQRYETYRQYFLAMGIALSAVSDM